MKTDRSTILVVDDQPDIVELISQILETEGYHILIAFTGEQALEELEKNPCDIVITDIRMPGMGGITLLREIKQSDPDVEVIIMTGFGSLEHAVRTIRDDGAFDYLTKPFNDLDRLIHTVDQALAKRRLNLKNKTLIQDIMKKKTMARTAMDSISDPIILLNPEQTIIGVNKAALTCFGLNDFHEAIGKLCYKVLGKSQTTCHGCRICNFLHTDQTIEFEQKGVWGDDIIENITIYPLQNKGIKQGILVKIQDITQKIKIEEQMQRTDRLASLGTLSAGVSHEIRNPLHVIQLFCGILEKEFAPSDKEKDILKEIKTSIARIDKIINQTLNFSRSQDISMEPIKINRLILENIKFWSSKFKTPGVKLELKLGNSLPAITGDKMSLHQVLNNLIANALDAVGKKGKIKIHTFLKPAAFHHNRSSLYIEIKDTGPGIKNDDLAKIFNPFFSTKATGTGLGLSITHKIIKKHGGSIQVKTRPDRGTAFIIELPVMPEQNKDNNLLRAKKEKMTHENSDCR
ncbi:MAG: response regulator [Desulfobacula sp.]|jgi:two-component system, NtrC family, sensor kinase|nr:response regulator [Desulfobacula sp.]MBT6338572.1 response regulator [Desulfobacula sp.]